MSYRIWKPSLNVTKFQFPLLSEIEQKERCFTFAWAWGIGRAACWNKVVVCLKMKPLSPGFSNKPAEMSRSQCNANKKPHSSHYAEIKIKWYSSDWSLCIVLKSQKVSIKVTLLPSPKTAVETYSSAATRKSPFRSKIHGNKYLLNLSLHATYCSSVHSYFKWWGKKKES